MTLWDANPIIEEVSKKLFFGEKQISLKVFYDFNESFPSDSTKGYSGSTLSAVKQIAVSRPALGLNKPWAM